jgi:hypothetical protein
MRIHSDCSPVTASSGGGLRYYQARYPDDDRVRVVTATARRCARGKATGEQLNAARDAALAAFEAIGPLPENLEYTDEEDVA